MMRQMSRSLLPLLEHICYRSSDFISQTILTKMYTSVRYGKTSNEFAFHDAASKSVTIFRKSVSSHITYKKKYIYFVSKIFVSSYCLCAPPTTDFPF
jgi:hypothetical protein